MVIEVEVVIGDHCFQSTIKKSDCLLRCITVTVVLNCIKIRRVAIG